MATVNVTLGVSSPDVLSTTVALSASTSLTVDSGTIIRAKVAATSGAGSGVTVYKADDKTVSAYVFVRNLAVDLEDFVYVYNDTDSDASVAKIGGGQFAFIPVAVDKTFKVYATKTNQLVEYGVFGNDDPSNTLG
jgi:hypothetical protein|tara:strand:- start:278 stop:682 length:405 start_codon:yes stop_codon:yes gene_type:complete